MDLIWQQQTWLLGDPKSPRQYINLQGWNKETVVWIYENRFKCKKKMENFKSRKKLSLSRPVEQRDFVFHLVLRRWSGGNTEACGVFYLHGWDKKNLFLMRHLIGVETTAIAAFRLVISMKSIFFDTHCFIVTVGAIQGCYGDCSSWQHRDVICVIAHPYCSCIEHTHAAIAHMFQSGATNRIV